MAIVTHWRCAWRMAAIAPASSTIFMISPPWTLPRALACSGSINWVSVTRDRSGDLGWAGLIGGTLPGSQGACYGPPGRSAAPHRVRPLFRPRSRARDGRRLLRDSGQLADLRARARTLSVRQGLRREGADVQP